MQPNSNNNNNMYIYNKCTEQITNIEKLRHKNTPNRDLKNEYKKLSVYLCDTDVGKNIFS